MVVDPADWQKNGPKESIVPPVVQVDVEIDSRGVVTAQPLIPPVIHVDAEIAPRATVVPTSEPLTPPVISDDAPTPSPRR
jgi:hypothetical protein